MTSQKVREKWLPNRERIGDEKIIYFLRRHWFVLFTKFLFLIVLGLIPVVMYFVSGSLFGDLVLGNTSSALLIMLTSLYYLFIWVIAFTVFIDYYLDIWIVTNHRIVDIEQKGLFNHVVSEQSLERVQDVSSSVKGLFPTFLDYGLVLIQSAAAQNLFHFKQVPEPEAVSRRINQLAQEYRTKHRGHGYQA